MPGRVEKTAASSPTRKISEGALEITAFINSNNPTLVALWKLEKPSISETATIRLRLAGSAESLGPEGDHRVKASEGKYNPPGHYKAICKLFLGYVNGGEEFIGTGWLVNDEMVVTAGHCLYEWSYKGGFLKYGVTAAAPAEYLKAESSVHDVSFVIGIHIAGGYPNVGSIIGPYGNNFEEYILAMDVKDGLTESSSVTVSQAKGLVPGFQLLSVQPQSTPGKKPSDPIPDITNGDESSLYKETGLDLLFGNKKPRSGNGIANGKRKAEGSLTIWPEKLILTEAGEPLPPIDFDKAVKNPKEQDDVKTTLFINFTEPLEGAALEAQQKLMSSVKTWQAWATTNCEAKVQQQVDAGDLPSHAKGQIARSTYRAKVLGYLFDSASWFVKTVDQSMNKEIKTKVLSFHSEILTNVLEGYAIPSSVFAHLEKALKQIAEGIKLSGENAKEAQQYWIMFTKYEYENISRTVQAHIRVISFQVTQDAKHYASSKGSYDEVSFDFSFHQYQAEFVQEVFAGVKEKMNKGLTEKGEELLEKRITDVVIPVK